MERTLKLGTAYHGNRILKHVEEDIDDIIRHHMNLVVQMYTHNDMVRHKNVVRDIVKMSKDRGLETWVDNWGIDAGPGDKSYFVALHPEAVSVWSDGSLNGPRPCYNHPAFRNFTKEWIDHVGESGADAIFWDEPHLNFAQNKGYTCYCPICQKKFEERFGYKMPAEFTDDVKEFRTSTIVDYFSEATDYAAKYGLKNTGCVMFSETLGINLDSMDRLLTLPNFDNVGCDPYWCGSVEKAEDVYEFVYSRTAKNLELCEKFGKDHNLWIQTYAHRTGHEDEIFIAANAAYDAGARTIITWSFRGGEPNDYRCENCETAWEVTGEAMAYLRQRHFEKILNDIRAKR